VNIPESSRPNDNLDLGMGNASRRNATRRGLYIGGACVAVVAAVSAVLILRDDPSKSLAPAAAAETSAPTVVSPPAPVTDAVITTPTTAETADAPETTPVNDLPTTVPTVAPASTLPETTVPAPAATTAPPASTTPAGPSLVDFAVDFTVDAPALEPAHLQSANSGFAGVTLDDRLFVASSEVVVFLDPSTGEALSWFTWSPNETRTVFGIGPDDVLYVNEHPEGQPSTLVAYAPAGEQYVEVARVPHTWGDVDPELDETGIALIDTNGSPSHFDYVDATGAPSGKTVARPAVTFNEGPQNVCDFTTSSAQYRLTFVWPETHLDDETSSACDGLDVGRGDTAVLTTVDYQTGGDPDTRITILSDSTSTFRSNGWSYVGQIGTRLFFTSDTGDGSIDIGTIEA